ncbi:MAG: hypothetical protein K6E20_00660 [Acholeplasmatales bacterium]|nr:hypothetical protein [Acholeplasmatales bacterium]
MAEYKYNVELYNIKNVIKDFNLDKLCATSSVKENIAISISEMEFYKSLIETSEPKLPSHIEKSIYRDIVLDMISVVEAIEFDLGAKLLGINRKKYSKVTDKICRSATSVISGITSGSKNSELYTQYRGLRHSLHLSNGESIEKYDTYTKEEAFKWIEFVKKYIKYLNDRYDYYQDNKDSNNAKERLKLLKEELNY